ncbi:uncharacterized protein LOC111373446 [Olea europaea var. sylvestris]|uniref:uncharacterized protein LOC111373446 n=1 Tax=Olea europaea var. sylvestris TaxID=158386 RepID=UPI000C1D50B8|nr:uncharacterized protein LOC111373446 [Olea europaea var. sylvestris]
MVVSQHVLADGPLLSDPTLYRSPVGALQYLIITHLDITHAINSVSQFLHSPTEEHFLVVKRILRYVKGTLQFGLTFHPSAALLGKLPKYFNCSTSSYSINLGGNLISWSAKKYLTISHCSCESEYRALALTVPVLLCFMHLFNDLKVSIPQQPLFPCNNKSAIFLSSSLVSHK